MSTIPKLLPEAPSGRQAKPRGLVLTQRQSELYPITKILSNALRFEHIFVGEASGLAATLRGGPIDLVIVDMANGGKFAENLLSAHGAEMLSHSLAILAVTDSPSDPLTGLALRLGADDTIQLGMNSDLLVSRVMSGLEMKRLRDDAAVYWRESATDQEIRHAAYILETLPDPIIVVRPDSTIELANVAASRLFEFSTSSLLGTNIAALLARTVDVKGAPPICVDALLGQTSNAILLVRSHGGPTKAVRLSAKAHEWFGRQMCICVIREVEWARALSIASHGDQLKSSAQLWSEISAQALARLEEAQRHVAIMRDQVFGPTGAPIYRSYLSDALCSLDQAKHLLDRQATGGSERRDASLPFMQMAEEALAICRPVGTIRQVALNIEQSPSDLHLRLPKSKFIELLTSLLSFATQATESGDVITLRAQVASDRRLLLLVDAGGTATSPAELALCCSNSPKPDMASHPLTVAWNEARVATRGLGGRMELSLDHPRGGFSVLAFLPQRREGDAA